MTEQQQADQIVAALKAKPSLLKAVLKRLKAKHPKVPPREAPVREPTSPGIGTRHTLSSGSRAYTPPGTPHPGVTQPPPDSTTSDEEVEAVRKLLGLNG